MKDLNRSADKRSSFRSDLMSFRSFDFNFGFSPLFEKNSKILNNAISIKENISPKTSEVFHESLQETLILRKLMIEEDVHKWSNLPLHSNIVTCYGSFFHEGKQYALSEFIPSTDMYRHIKAMGIKLSEIKLVPLNYIQLLYDFIIQISYALEFAHAHDIIHGKIHLGNILVQSDANNSLVFKITDFRTTNLMSPTKLTFSKHLNPLTTSKVLSSEEKLEMLKEKDIYMLGIGILEIMTGKISKSKLNLSLDNVPDCWASFSCCTTLIQIIVECLNLSKPSHSSRSPSTRTHNTKAPSKLKHLREMVLEEYEGILKRTFSSGPHYAHSDLSSILNNRAVFNKNILNDSSAEGLWSTSLKIDYKHYETNLNYLIARRHNCLMSDDQFLQSLIQISQGKDKQAILEGFFLVGFGYRNQGLNLLRSHFTPPNSPKVIKIGFQNPNVFKIWKMKETFRSLHQYILLHKQKFFQNIDFNLEEQICGVKISENGKFCVCASKEKLFVIQIQPTSILHTFERNAPLIKRPEDQKDKGRAPFDKKESSKFILRNPTNVLLSIDNQGSIVLLNGKAAHFFNAVEIGGYSVEIYHVLLVSQGIGVVPYKEEVLIQDLKTAEEKENKKPKIEDLHICNDNINAMKILARGEGNQYIQFQINRNTGETMGYSILNSRYENSPSIKRAGSSLQKEKIARFIKKKKIEGFEVKFPYLYPDLALSCLKGEKGGIEIILYNISEDKIEKRIEIQSCEIGDELHYDVSSDAKVAVYSCHEYIFFKSIRIPSEIEPYFKPIYLCKLNFNPKVYAEDLETYMKTLGEAFESYTLKSKTEEERYLNLIELNKNISIGNEIEGINSNEKFFSLYYDYLTINDSLLAENKTTFVALKPILNIHNLPFTSPLERIRFVDIERVDKSNIVLLYLNGIVYAYDHFRRNMLTSLRTEANKLMKFMENGKVITCIGPNSITLLNFDTNKLTLLKTKKETEEIYSGTISKLENEKFFIGIICNSGIKIFSHSLSLHCEIKDTAQIEGTKKLNLSLIYLISIEQIVKTSFLVLAYCEPPLLLYDINQKKFKTCFNVGCEGVVSAITSTQKYLLVSSTDFRIYKFNLVANTTDYLKGKDPTICREMKTDPYGLYLVSGYEDRSIIIWDLDSDTIIYTTHIDVQGFQLDMRSSSLCGLSSSGREIKTYSFFWYLRLKQREPIQKQNINRAPIVNKNKPQLKDPEFADPKMRGSTCCYIF